MPHALSQFKKSGMIHACVHSANTSARRQAYRQDGIKHVFQKLQRNVNQGRWSSSPANPAVAINVELPHDVFHVINDLLLAHALFLEDQEVLPQSIFNNFAVVNTDSIL